MAQAALQLVGRPLAEKLFLPAPAVCPAHSPLVFPDTPAQARLSARLIGWLTENGAGHRPSPVSLRIDSFELLGGQVLRDRLTRGPQIYGEHSLLMRLLSHDSQENENDDPRSPGFVLSAEGGPNLLPVGENLAINICRIAHFRHVDAHWDCDIGLIDDRQGKYANLRVINVVSKH